MHGIDLATLCPLTTEDALRRAATIAPDVEAIVAPSGRLTFARLAGEVAAIRAALAAAGVERGEHVGLCLGNGPRWMALFLAAGSLGTVVVPLNTRWRGEEMAYALRQSRVRTLITADRFLRTDFVSLLRGIEPAIDAALPGHALPNPAGQGVAVYPIEYRARIEKLIADWRPDVWENSRAEG